MARHQKNSWSGNVDRDAASPFTVFDTEEVPIPVPSSSGGSSSSSSPSNDGPDLGKYADMWVEPANRTLPTPQNQTIWDKMQNLDDKLNTGFDNFIKSNPVTEFLARAGNSAADVMTGGQQIQDNYDTGSKLANGVADLLGVAGGMIENIPGTAINTGNALSTAVGKPAEDVLTRVSNRFGIPNTLEDAANSVANRFSQLASKTDNGLAKATINKLSQGTQYGLNNLPSYTIKGLSSGAELGAYNGTTNAINGRDVRQGIAEGMGQGMLLGAGSKALGDFTHVIKGIGKVKVLKDDGNKVMFQDENGKTQTMNKTIFDNTVQSLNTMNPAYDNTNWHNINPIENKIPTLDTNTPLQNKVAQNKPIVDINRLQNKLPSMNEAATGNIPNNETQNKIPALNENTNKLYDFVKLNNNNSIEGGAITKINNDGTYEVQRENGSYVLARKNGDTFETVNSQPTPKDQLPLSERDNINVGDKNIKSYQYLHPELKSYIQDEAQAMLGELKDTQRHERVGIDKNGTQSGYDTPRITSDDIKYLRDNTKMSYEKIQKGLEKLINDDGAENNADSKRIELVIDNRLSNGYKDFKTGYDVEPNQEYISKKNGIETGLNEIMNTDYNKVNDIDTLNNHISELQNSIKNTTDETKLKAMNLQLFAAQARLQKLNNVVRPDIETPGSKILFNGKKDKFSFKNSLNNFKNSINNAYTRMVDINKPTSDFSKVSGDEAYIKSINSKNVGGVVDHILQNGLVDREGNKIGFSLKQLVKQIPKKSQEQFWEYMMHKHNIDRAAADKNIYMNYDSEASKKAVDEFEKLNPDLKKAGDNITKWLNKFMGEWGNKSGLISDDLWQSLQKQYPNYIPTNRVFNELEKSFDKTNGKGFVDQTSPLSRAKGSDKDIDNPIVNIMKLVNRTVRTAKYNEVGQEVLNSIRKSPDKLRNFAEIIPEDSKESLDRDNVVRVLENGEPVHIRINSKPFLDSLKAINKSNVGDIEGAVKKATNLFKALITTKNPLFALSNAARDLPTYLVNSKENNPLAAMWNLGGAYKDILTNGEAYKKYKAVGGGGSNFFNSEKPYKSAKDLTRRGLLPMLNEGIEGFNNVFENAPRLAEFKRTLKKTGDVNKALYDSSEVTTNFARGGDITKHIDSFVPYLSAGVQGLDKLGRQIVRHPFATAGKGLATITAPTLLLDNYNKDNENYKKLDNRTKDNYFLIPNGDKFIKIPKTRELGVLFGSLAERIMRQKQGDADAFKGFGNTVATNFAPASPIENNIAAPLIYNLPSNKDFAGRSIVPQSMLQDERSPYLQYDEKTSEIAKKMGELTGYSPKKIDYIIGAYTGVVGQFLQPLTTESTKTGSKTGDLLSPLTSRFTADPLYNNQSLQDFYENMANAKRAAADNNIINNVDPKTTTHEERLSSEFTKASKDISDLTKESFQALQDGDMAKVKELRQKIIDTATSTNKYMPLPGQDQPDLPTPASEIQANVEGRLKGKRSTEATEIRKEIKTISKSDMSAEERTQRLNQLLDAAQNAPQKNPSKRK